LRIADLLLSQAYYPGFRPALPLHSPFVSS
jgi:hypothetical protein